MKPTQEQVIAWAQELGWVGLSSEFVSAVTLAYEAGCKDENEACAKVCEEVEMIMWREYTINRDPHFGSGADASSVCAAAIRARGHHD